MIHTRKNNGSSKSLNLGEVADLVGGQIVGGDKNLLVTGVAGIRDAQKGDITFLGNDKYLPFLYETQASAAIVPYGTGVASLPLVQCENPTLAFTKIAVFFAPEPVEFPVGTHPTAVIDDSAFLGAGVSLGPHAVICEGAQISKGCMIGANVFIGAHCCLGEDVIIYPNVTVREHTQIGDRSIIHSGAVIGSDGYGYETIEGEHEKIPHIGYVQIDEDVEIGANVCVDRGRFKRTWIQRGVKIDNLVQIGHNVVIGPNSLIVSQAGISGSTRLGRNVIIAGQAGLVGHISIGDHAVIGAGAGVSKPVPANEVVLGSPAKPIREQKRLFAYISRLPDLFKDVATLKKKFMDEK